MIASTHIIDNAEPALPLPPLTEHDAALFQQLAEARFDLLALSSATNHRLADLLDWYFSPPIQARVEALRIAAEQTAALWAAKCRPSAVRALGHLSETVEDPLERRRAAATLAAHSRPHPLPRRITKPRPAAAEPGAAAPDQPQAHTSPIDAPAAPRSHAAEPPSDAQHAPAGPCAPGALLSQTPAHPAPDATPATPNAAESLNTHAPGPAPPQVRSAA